MSYIYRMPKTFSNWLANQADKTTAVGELARAWMNHYTELEAEWIPDAKRAAAQCSDYLLREQPGQIAELAQALASYATYLKRWAARQQ